jgi:hypothetical protein
MADKEIECCQIVGIEPVTQRYIISICRRCQDIRNDFSNPEKKGMCIK